MIILASSSPRRRELLTQIGVSFEARPADIDESVLAGEMPRDYVSRLAREKALHILNRDRPGYPVLGSDTAVILDDQILGKPESKEEALAMLRTLSGRSHEVHSAVAVATPEGEIFEDVNVSRVTFGELDDDWLEAYIESGDPMDKAGAYGVQGKAGEKIACIEGSFYCVMGLPLYETAQLLRRAEVIF